MRWRYGRDQPAVKTKGLIAFQIAHARDGEDQVQGWWRIEAAAQPSPS
jgi:hypothetical protein